MDQVLNMSTNTHLSVSSPFPKHRTIPGVLVVRAGMEMSSWASEEGRRRISQLHQRNPSLRDLEDTPETSSWLGSECGCREREASEAACIFISLWNWPSLIRKKDILENYYCQRRLTVEIVRLEENLDCGYSWFPFAVSIGQDVPPSPQLVSNHSLNKYTF